MSHTKAEAGSPVGKKSFISYAYLAQTNPFKGVISINLDEYIEAIWLKNIDPSPLREQHAKKIFLSIKNEFYGFNACYISHHFFQHLFAGLTDPEQQSIMLSPVIHVLDHVLIEILKNSIDSWIELYFLTHVDKGFDPSERHLVTLELSLSLDGGGVHVSCQDNGGGFSESFLERFDHRDQQLDYIRFGVMVSEKNANYPLRKQYGYHHFGGRGLGLRQMMSGMLTHHLNPQKAWSDLSASEFASIIRDERYEVNFRNAATGGAVIDLLSPLMGPFSMADDQHLRVGDVRRGCDTPTLIFSSSENSLSSLSDEAATTRSVTPVSAISSRAATPYASLFVFIPEDDSVETDFEIERLRLGGKS